MSDDQKIADKSEMLERGLGTDIALVATPIAVAVAPSLAVATDHFLNRPAEPEPPKVEQAPGYRRDEPTLGVFGQRDLVGAGEPPGAGSGISRRRASCLNAR